MIDGMFKSATYGLSFLSIIRYSKIHDKKHQAFSDDIRLILLTEGMIKLNV